MNIDFDKHRLNKKSPVCFEDIIHQFMNTQTLDDLAILFQNIVVSLGGAKFAFAQFRTWNQASCFSLIHTYDQEWTQHYIQKQYNLCDPVYLAFETLYNPYAWDFSKSQDLSPKQKVLFKEASDFGLCSGLTVPIVDLVSRTRSFMTIIGDTKNLHKTEILHTLWGVSRLFWERKQSIEKQNKLQKLSPREFEVLTLKSQGHMIKSIASKLNLSESTVREYLDNAKLKLGCTSMEQALFRYGQLAC